jgi:hypothetical protein
MTERKFFTPFVDDGTMTEYVTRDGQPARVCVSNEANVINGFIWTPKYNKWVPRAWFSNGFASSYGDSKQDLFDVPVKHTRWTNVYPEDDGRYTIKGSHPSKRLADKVAGTKRIACIEVTFEEGEGL